MSETYLPDLPLPPLSNSDSGGSSKTANSGPFGMSMGLRKEDIDTPMTEIRPCLYQADTLPKKHSAFQYYILQITPVQGLSWIKAIGNPISTNSYGNQVQDKFKEMREKLINIYGRPEDIDFLMYDSIWNEPRDWMNALDSKERYLAAKWEYKKRTNSPSNLESIYLFASADGTSIGNIGIEYAFKNLDASEKEIGMMEDDAL